MAGIATFLPVLVLLHFLIEPRPRRTTHAC
jgi:hypothetical protein